MLLESRPEAAVLQHVHAPHSAHIHARQGMHSKDVTHPLLLQVGKLAGQA